MDIDSSPVFQQLVGSLKATYEQYRIFQIPDILYCHKKDAYLAYRPNGFSIGPWHHGKPYVHATSKVKDLYREMAIYQCKGPGGVRGELRRVVQNLEERARRCYGDQISMDQKEFVEMLERDSCFIIELFWRYYKNPSITNEGLPSTLMFQFTYHDLILLENQLPWFVLESVYAVVGNKMAGPHVPLRVLTINFFKNIFTCEGIYEPKLNIDQFDHILDLLRSLMFVSCDETKQSSSCFAFNLVPKCFKPKEKLEGIETARRTASITPDDQNSRSVIWHLKIPSASRLDEAGVSFKRSRSKPMLSISFEKGVLELPQLIIDDNTEALFRNLIAYEQCQWKGPPAVTSFAKLMDHLIDTVEDVHILCKHGIICDLVGPENVVRIFDGICTDTYVDWSYYGKVYAEVNSYCRKWWPRWRSFTIGNHFGKPWAIASQIFALLILALTILQVVLK